MDEANKWTLTATRDWVVQVAWQEHKERPAGYGAMLEPSEEEGDEAPPWKMVLESCQYLEGKYWITCEYGSGLGHSFPPFVLNLKLTTEAIAAIQDSIEIWARVIPLALHLSSNLGQLYETNIRRGPFQRMRRRLGLRHVGPGEAILVSFCQGSEIVHKLRPHPSEDIGAHRRDQGLDDGRIDLRMIAPIAHCRLSGGRAARSPGNRAAAINSECVRKPPNNP